MKKSLVKKIISCVLVLILVFGSLISTYAYSIQTSTISGTIKFDKTLSVDVTKIKLEVYKLSLLRSDEISSDYAHIYETTVSPDKNGNVKINRPSDYCYIKVDVDSLPSGFGVDNTGFLIAPNENIFSVLLSAISDFSVDFSDDSVNFFDKNNLPLFVSENYKLNYDNSVEQVFLNSTKNQEKTLTKSIDADCTFGSVKVQSKQSIESLSATDKIEFLHRKEYITEEEKIYAYIDSLESGVITNNDEISNAFATIAYYQCDNITPRLLDDAVTNLVSSYIPEYNNEATYTRDFFTIHYERYDTAIQLIVDSAYNYLDLTKTTLCTTFGFELPDLAPGESNYQVYLARDYDDTKPSGYNVPVFVDGELYTFIVVYYENNQYGLTRYQCGTMCHEFTHAIQHQYSPAGNIAFPEETTNFNESVANTVKSMLVTNCNLGWAVTRFQESPELSLLSTVESGDYELREYGALLFPLSIVQEYDNLNTIRQIYEENRQVKNIYVAIDNVLQRSNSSLKEAYATCARFNYDLQYYYDYCQSDWTTPPKLSEINTNTLPYEAVYLSSRYFEITDPSYNSFTITFNNTDDIRSVKLQRVDSINNELINSNYSLFTPTITTSLNLNTYDKVCFIVSNVSSQSPIEYSVRVY